MISLRLRPDLEKRLNRLAKKTHRTKTFYATQAIERHLEDLEDYYEALEVLKEGGKSYSLEEVMKENGLDS